MLIDCHTHLGEFQPGVISTAEQLVASMREASIDYSIVIATHFLNAPNELVIQASQTHPQLKAIGCVELGKIAHGQVDQLITWLKEEKIIAVKFYPGYENYFPYEQQFHPLFSFCEQHGFPVMFHTGLLMSGLRGFAKQAHPLTIDEVCYHYPKLKILMAHLGTPWMTDTMAVLYKNPNTFVDISAHFTEFQPINEAETTNFLRQMENYRSYMGSFDRCLFGSDWPLYSQKEYLDVAEKLPLTDKEHQLLFWQNAAQLFNLSLN